ncbi:unnamed protein product [Heligmosomoides polygyrus]|uniref:UDENN domain-containing protein n=1 Tax=Heligmosomoides polygyrus TaxID=6339 RepID=A0A3P8AVJ5_HELPZ|nr:unnamed protein product [Heligmosomoides polygyrus]
MEEFDLASAPAAYQTYAVTSCVRKQSQNEDDLAGNARKEQEQSGKVKRSETESGRSQNRSSATKSEKTEQAANRREAVLAQRHDKPEEAVTAREIPPGYPMGSKAQLRAAKHTAVAPRTDTAGKGKEIYDIFQQRHDKPEEAVTAREIPPGYPMGSKAKPRAAKQTEVAPRTDAAGKQRHDKPEEAVTAREIPPGYPMGSKAAVAPRTEAAGKVAAKVSPSPQHKTVSRASSPARQTRQATRSAASSEAATRTQTTNSNRLLSDPIVTPCTDQFPTEEWEGQWIAPAVIFVHDNVTGKAEAPSGTHTSTKLLVSDPIVTPRTDEYPTPPKEELEEQAAPKPPKEAVVPSKEKLSKQRQPMSKEKRSREKFHLSKERQARASVENRQMLVLATDSGYNSPCAGLEPSFSSDSSFFGCRSPFGLSSTKRKLCFDSSDSTHESSAIAGSLIPGRSVNPRSREIARRLLRLCDSFNEEFDTVSRGMNESSIEEEPAWFSTTLRYLSSWL